MDARDLISVEVIIRSLSCERQERLRNPILLPFRQCSNFLDGLFQ